MSFSIKCLVRLCLIIFVIKINPVVGDVTEPPCCPGVNIYPTTCTNRTNLLLYCEYGKFMIDPAVNAEDAFEVMDNGDLRLQDDHIVDRGEYCITNYKSGNTTSRIAFICFSQDITEAHSLFLIKGILTLISVGFLAITLYVYAIIPGLRETQDKVTCFCLISLLIFFLLLGLVQIIQPENLSEHHLCIPLAYSLYFFVMSYFSWLNVVMANVWKLTVLPRWHIRERYWYFYNHLYAWLVPLMLVGTMALSHFLTTEYSPRIGYASCWFLRPIESLLYLYLPISVMLTLNLIFFVWTCWVLNTNGADISPDRRRTLQYKCFLYLKLFLLVGLTWIFEVFSYFFGSYSWFWFAVDVMNSLHGILIFLILVIWRKRIRKELAGKRICCFRGPQSWSYVEDAEQECLNETEDNYKYSLIIK